MTLIFLVLSGIFAIAKLNGSLDWSWWWVMAPLWGYISAVLLIFLEGNFWSKKFKKLKEQQERRELAKNL